MTRDEAHDLAWAVRMGLPTQARVRLKAIHVMPKLHEGFLTIRVFMVNQTADDPEPFVFVAEEI